ncbi:MAG: hypothetical protein H6629_11825 [Calditrichae bacterium]|nr:hypothetical protein [Calditrichia bacterium]
MLKEEREIKKFDGFFDLYSFFLKDSLKVIQRVDLGYNRQINDEFSLRSVSPFMNPIEYEIVKQQFVAYLEEHGKAISGIVDDDIEDIHLLLESMM